MVDILLQDNDSSMLMNKSEPFSIGKASKHINYCYFFVTDKIEKDDAEMIEILPLSYYKDTFLSLSSFKIKS